MRRRLFPSFIGDVVQIEEKQERMERVMQMLGITPEYPYTMNVNDGTRNRVLIGLIGADYGIQIIDNVGNSILLANGTIVANAIKTGTLDCSLITVANLNAGSIVTGTLSASFISGGTFNASLMTVTNLNAGSITVGTFSSINNRLTNEAIDGVKITQNTIYGNRIVANSINADRIQAGTITADRITAKTITADRILDYSLGTNQLIPNGVNGDRLINETITNAKIANATITYAKIASLSADLIIAGTLNGRTVNVGSEAGGGSINLKGDSPMFLYSGGTQMARFWAAGGAGGQVNLLGAGASTLNLIFTNVEFGGYVKIPNNYLQLSGKTLNLSQSLNIYNTTSIGMNYISSGGSQFNWWNGKSAIVPTSKGYRALFCMESPELWFMDFCESREKIDPLFLEATEGKMKFIKCVQFDKEGKEIDDGYLVSRRRKGALNIRFPETTKEHYEANKNFWETPRRLSVQN